MRQVRILTALFAALAMLLLGFSNVSSADAQVASHTTARKLPQHIIKNLTPGTASKNHFYVKGNVTTAKGHKIILQKAPKGTNKWSFKASKKAAKNSGFFRINFTSPVHTCFRILVKATKFRRQTTRKVGCIVRA